MELNYELCLFSPATTSKLLLYDTTRQGIYITNGSLLGKHGRVYEKL
jgi:hypothetical protein